MDTQPKRIKYIALQDWDKHHDFPSVKHFRKLLQSASKNGLDKIVRKVGGLIVIKEEEFFEWVENHPYKGIEEEPRKKRGRPREIDNQINKEEDQKQVKGK